MDFHMGFLLPPRFCAQGTACIRPAGRAVNAAPPNTVQRRRKGKQRGAADHVMAAVSMAAFWGETL